MSLLRLSAFAIFKTLSVFPSVHLNQNETMKRASSIPSDSRRRKSARLAAQTHLYPLAEVCVDESAICNKNCLSLRRLSGYCTVYNAWLPFTISHENVLPGSLVHESGYAFRIDFHEIREILEDTKGRLSSKYAQIQQNLRQFETSIRMDFDEWYEAGDIFSISCPSIVHLSSTD